MSFLRSKRSILTLLLCVLICVLSWPVWSQKKHQHKAHQHGQMTIQIVYENGHGHWELVVPMEVVVGFEHAPRNDKQKKQWENGIEQLRKSVFLQLPEACQIKEKKDHVEQHGSHSEFFQTADFMCLEPIKERQITIDWDQLPKRLRMVHLEILSGNQAKTHTIKQTQQVPF